MCYNSVRGSAFMKIYYETPISADLVKDAVNRSYGEYLRELHDKKSAPDFVKRSDKPNELVYYLNVYNDEKTSSDHVNSRFRISIEIEQRFRKSVVCVKIVNGYKKIFPPDPLALILIFGTGFVSLSCSASSQYMDIYFRPYTYQEYLDRYYLAGSPLLQFVVFVGVGCIFAAIYTFIRRFFSEPKENPQEKMNAFASRLLSKIPKLKPFVE